MTPFKTCNDAHGKCFPRRSGFTLIEVVITASVLFIGLLAMTSTTVVTHSLRGSYADKQIAQGATQGVVEDLYGLSAAAAGAGDAWAQTILDAYGPAGLPGANFQVRGLEPWTGNGTVGTVQIVTDETLSDDDLGVSLGLPRDLNGDGAIDDTDVSDNAVLLPVIIRVQWDGHAGQRQLQQSIYLLQY